MLEHLVDVVVQFEGDRHSRLRLVRAVKNRYGPTDEVGCFDLSDVGIVGLADPSGLFLSSRDLSVPGTCVTVTLEGRRPLVTEVQALVGRRAHPDPAAHHQRARRVAGRDDPRRARPARRRAGAASADVYVVHRRRRAAHRAGRRPGDGPGDGQRGRRPGRCPRAPSRFGEVGLAGEIRPVTGVPRRLAEAARLGFAHGRACPRASLGGGPTPDGMQVVEVSDIRTRWR